MKFVKLMSALAGCLLAIETAHAAVTVSPYPGGVQIGGAFDQGTEIAVSKVGSGPLITGVYLTYFYYYNIDGHQIDGPLNLDCGCWTFKVDGQVHLNFANGHSYAQSVSYAQEMIIGGIADAEYEISFPYFGISDFSDPGLRGEFGGDGTALFTFSHDLRFSAVPGINVSHVEITPSLQPQGQFSVTIATAPDAVPEPATWATMILGFGVIGGGMRRRARIWRLRCSGSAP